MCANARRSTVLRALVGAAAVVTALVAGGRLASAQPNGAELVRLLGSHARAVFAPPAAPGMGALVRLPDGVRASDLGLAELAPGFGRIWGDPSRIVAFATDHPGLRVEVSPPLHLLLDTAAAYVGATAANASGRRGAGVLVGIADTGIDVTHPDFLDASGGTRVAWLLDLSAKPIGKHPDLEQRYGSTDSTGKVVAGAVWSKADIDASLTSGARSGLPQDEIGHGTLVAACAAGDDPRYRGVAPAAGLLVARITEAGSGSIGSDELLRGTAFLFDRADFMQQPVVVNLSIGTDFGPHDGTEDWEQALASFVGSDHPGHALVAAAGNSGSIDSAAGPLVHQNVHVSGGSLVRVPIVASGATSGSVQVWVDMHRSAQLSVGLDGPGGTWIPPVGDGDSAGAQSGGYTAAIYNGSGASSSPVPGGSLGAVVAWDGSWPSGEYDVTLVGHGTADLYIQASGQAEAVGVGFADGVRESTINLPATHPRIIGVGCTINKTSWTSIDRVKLGLQSPVLDPAGGELAPGGGAADPAAGEPCWFSSAGPTIVGVPKPEIMAPGAAIVGALSQQALPSVAASIFSSDACPASASGAITDCQQIDATHGVSFGTSFSSPLVAGAIAILLERDPTLTQDAIVAALQGGSHPLRAPGRFDDQAGAGELDVVGALAALDQRDDPALALPASTASWMTLGADVYLADGSTPLEALVELRAAPAAGAAATPADGFDPSRLAVYTLVDGSPYGGRLSPERRGPGVWVATIALPAGLGGASLTVGAAFDGRDIVEPRTVPIAADVWSGEYPPGVTGGCAVVSSPPRVGRGAIEVAAAVGASVVARRRRSQGRKARRLPVR